MFPPLLSRIQGWRWSWCLRWARGLPCGHFNDPNLLRQGPARGSRLACNFPPLPMTAVQPPNGLLPGAPPAANQPQFDQASSPP